MGVDAVLAGIVARLLVLGPWWSPVCRVRGRRNGDAAQVVVARWPWRWWRQRNVAGGRARGLGRRGRNVLMHGDGTLAVMSRSAAVCALARARWRTGFLSLSLYGRDEEHTMCSQKQ